MLLDAVPSVPSTSRAGPSLQRTASRNAFYAKCAYNVKTRSAGRRGSVQVFASGGDPPTKEILSDAAKLRNKATELRELLDRIKSRQDSVERTLVDSESILTASAA